MKVAFIGKMFSGKTTAAEFLVDRYGYERLAFARPVKEIAAEMLNVLEKHIADTPVRPVLMPRLSDEEIQEMIDDIKNNYVGTESHRPFLLSDEPEIMKLPPKEWHFADVEQKKGHPAVRKLLQLIGTELGRELVGYEDVWVDKLLYEAYGVKQATVDDCRFINEANALKSHGFTIVRVDRPVEDRLALMKQKYPTNYQEIMAHPSEMELDSFEADVLLYAETVEELYTKVSNLIDN